jgi:hypothetical protein
MKIYHATNEVKVEGKTKLEESLSIVILFLLHQPKLHLNINQPQLMKNLMISALVDSMKGENLG